MVRRSRIISVLGLLGAGDAAYGLFQHYAPAGTAFCNVSDVISCDLVNKSVYSEAFGVPVALVGALGFLAVAAVALAAARKEKARLPLFALAIAGFAVQGYLTWVELGVLRAVCLICITSQTIIAAIALLAVPRRPDPAEGQV